MRSGGFHLIMNPAFFDHCEYHFVAVPENVEGWQLPTKSCGISVAAGVLLNKSPWDMERLIMLRTKLREITRALAHYTKKCHGTFWETSISKWPWSSGNDQSSALPLPKGTTISSRQEWVASWGGARWSQTPIFQSVTGVKSSKQGPVQDSGCTFWWKGCQSSGMKRARATTVHLRRRLGRSPFKQLVPPWHSTLLGIFSAPCVSERESS